MGVFGPGGGQTQEAQAAYVILFSTFAEDAASNVSYGQSLEEYQ